MIRLQLFSGFLLECDGTRVMVPDTGQRVVALLALNDGRCGRAHVAGSLWPDVTDQHALASLRTTVWRLLKCCPDLLTTTAFDIALTPDVVTDVAERFHVARRLFDADPSTDDDADVRDIPLRQFGCELLPGWHDDWVLIERERVRQLDLHVLQIAAQRLAQRGRFGSAIEAAWHAVQIDPLRESAHQLVIEIHLAEGNVRDAVRQYQLCEALLRQELGVRPTRRLRNLMCGAYGDNAALNGDGPLGTAGNGIGATAWAGLDER